MVGANCKFSDIPNADFSPKSNLETVIIPDGVTTIGWNALSEMVNLKKVSIPESVIRIGYMSFYGCAKLDDVYISNAVNAIEEFAFKGCTSLRNITIENGNPQDTSRTWLTGIPNGCFWNCTKITDIEWLPDHINGLGSDAFRGTKIQSIELGENALDPLYTGSLYNRGVRTIGARCFAECSRLSGATINKTVWEYGLGLFQDCTSLLIAKISDTSYKFSNSGEGKRTVIPYDLFSGCTSLEKVSLPKYATNWGSNMFYHCESLEKVTMPAGDPVNNSYPTTIPISIFEGCTNLKKVELAYPNRFQYIHQFAFKDCAALTDIPLSGMAGLLQIGNQAFMGCTSLTTAPASDVLTSIGSQAFADCSSLTSIAIPSTCQTIGTNAFSGCTSLQTITIHRSQDAIDGAPWGADTSTTNIVWDGNE